MNGRTLIGLALKICGLILLVSAVADAPFTLAMAGARPGLDTESGAFRASQLAYILSIIGNALVGGALVAWSDRLAGLVCHETPPLSFGLDALQAQVLAFALLGVFLLVSGAEDLAAAIYTLRTTPEHADAASYVWDRQGDVIPRTLVRIVAGVSLVFGRETIARGWSRLRGESTEDANQDVEDQSR